MREYNEWPCPATAQSSSAIRVTCEKCGRDGRYIVARLIRKRGRDAKLIDWLDELTADCSKKQARNMNDTCGARCPDLARVLYPPVKTVLFRGRGSKAIPSLDTGQAPLMHANVGPQPAQNVGLPDRGRSRSYVPRVRPVVDMFLPDA